ncbi:FAD-dependent oxidoreductase [bacterium]|nr:FAD-dependent oxidoreductase [bacterium]
MAGFRARMHHQTLIIGAGIAGLLAARSLQDAGARVTVLEKSRGLGGRLATKRVGDAVFDQGAQYFTVKDPRFAAWVDCWETAGVVARWPDGERMRYVGRPSMTAVAKVLGEGLDIKREHKVTAIGSCGDHWCVDVENHGCLRAERIILTAPVPQALALLKAGEFTLPEALATRLAAVSYDPCLALLVTLGGRSRLPAEGVRREAGAIRWAADNQAKGVSPNVAAVTLHLAPDFSTEHYGRTDAEVLELVRAEAEDLIGAPIAGATLHRWKFSHARVTDPEPFIWLPKVRLGFAGDALGGPRVEGAALSGLALAECVKAELARGLA